MQKKKGTLTTFIFSLLPGAGEMYMGFMKRGISTMFIFFFTFFVASMLRVESIVFVMPIIWFYSFFSVHNIKGLPDDEFYALEDDFIFNGNLLLSSQGILSKKFHKIIAGILIVIGVTMLMDNLIDMLAYFFPNILVNIFYRFQQVLPRSILSLLLIFCGIYLIQGKKKQLDRNEMQADERIIEVEEKRDGETN